MMDFVCNVSDPRHVVVDLFGRKWQRNRNICPFLSLSAFQDEKGDGFCQRTLTKLR